MKYKKSFVNEPFENSLIPINQIIVSCNLMPYNYYVDYIGEKYEFV